MERLSGSAGGFIQCPTFSRDDYWVRDVSPLETPTPTLPAWLHSMTLHFSLSLSENPPLTSWPLWNNVKWSGTGCGDGAIRKWLSIAFDDTLEAIYCLGNISTLVLIIPPVVVCTGSAGFHHVTVMEVWMNIVTVSFLRSNPVGTLQKNTFEKTSPCVQLIVQARGWGTVATSCTFSFPLPSHHFYVYPMTLQWNNWICFHIVPFFFFFSARHKMILLV